MNKNSRPNILIFAPTVNGGLAEHTFYQARALKKTGAEVICLVAPAFLNRRQTPFETVVCLNSPAKAGGPVLVKKIRMVLSILFNRLALAWQILKRRPDLVLLDSFVEYGAPLWIWLEWLMARVLHVRYAANLHDPVRNYQVGPVWWHKLSVHLAYLPLDLVLVHDHLPNPSPVPTGIKICQVPVGVYDLSSPTIVREETRRIWGANPDQKIFLSFGFVRDGKNLDLAIRALPSVPEVFLVIAGAVASSKDKPFIYYRELAKIEGVSDRVTILEGFVSDVALSNYFLAADFVLLTYSSAFHSQSGVLNIAVRARLPVIASASPSPMLESVKRFDLGVTIDPDRVETIVKGIRQLLEKKLCPRWEDYEAFADWDANAQGLLKATGLSSHEFNNDHAQSDN